MKIEPLSIAGAYKISPQKIGDERGSFSRVYCEDIFRQNGLNTNWVQMNTSRNREKGTVRGLHYQRPPCAEVKLVRAVRGTVFDVFVDLRQGSSSFGTACCVTLESDGFEMVYIPQGCAHGFQTLSDDVELHYMHSAVYAPKYEAGLDLTDPALNIRWPLPFAVVSDRDKTHPSLATTEPIIL